MRSAVHTPLVGLWSLFLVCAVPLAGCLGGVAADERSAHAGTPIPVKPHLVLNEWVSTDSTGQFDYLYKPGSVALDEHGAIYVLDSMNHRVVVFSSAGEHLFTFGQSGHGPGEFRFGIDGGDDISLVENRIVTLEKQRGRIQVFDRQGAYISSFAVPLAATGMSANLSSIYISVLPAAAGEPTIFEFDYSGNQTRALGSAHFSSHLRLFNNHCVAVDRRGLVLQAFLFFPLLRTFDLSGDAVEQWYDLSWWENRDLALSYMSGRNSQQDFESLGVGGAEADRRLPNFGEIPQDLRLQSLIRDLEYLEKADLWLGLIFGGVVQAFSGDGTPLEAYLFESPDQEHRTMARDFGATPDGQALCIADNVDSVVRCFRIANGWR